MKKALPVGISDFEKIRSNGYYYVDKTPIIAEWLALADEVTLITRPRRFGKTLNMTMLRAFFAITKNSRALFDGLAIMDTAYAVEINSWPVIYLSFKDCKDDKETMLKCLYRQLLSVYQEYAQAIKPDAIDAIRLERIMDILTEERIVETSSINDCIYFLSKLLHQAYGQKVIILIDEYDTPMINAYEQGYYEGVRALFRSLYGTALKDNTHLERAMLTGIHHIAKENIFSGLNNLEVCTVLDQEYDAYFGLTTEETADLLKYYGLSLHEQVKAMYNGYHIGRQEIYNPWSIIKYAKKKRLQAYWVNTASNDMLIQVIMDADQNIKNDFERLLSKGHARVPVDLQTSFFELNQAEALWGLFLDSGYLTVSEGANSDGLQMEVCIPNEEVNTSFRKIVERYGGFQPNSLDSLFDALQRKDFEAFGRNYQQIILTCTSFHDGLSENAYHMLFLGMCVYLDRDYRISSNIESGYGRADIILAAKRSDLPNFIIEFKQGNDLEHLALEALAQIHEKKYYASLNGETILLGIAHDLKQCQVISELMEG